MFIEISGMNQQQSRRHFLRKFAFSAFAIAGSNWFPVNAASFEGNPASTRLRFAVASDPHYGQPKTEYDTMINTVISQINLTHQLLPFDFCVFNGDLIHNEKPFLQQVKQQLNKLTMPWYVTRGNHDMVSEDEWKSAFGMPLNHDVIVKDYGIILGDTSNEKGTYLPADLYWLKATLEKHRSRNYCFLFLHIPQAKWTANGVDNPAFFPLIEQYPNLKAVFHGHEHDQDSFRMHKQVPFFFDAHVGGSWGTDYKGFRIVELMEDGNLLTYMMNPSQKMIEQRF
jgi:hypothetical protein